jgi:hypothetical protein
MRMQVITHTLLVDGVVYNNVDNPIIAVDANLSNSAVSGLISGRKVQMIPDDEAERIMTDIHEKRVQAIDNARREAAIEEEVRKAAENTRHNLRNASENQTKFAEGATGGAATPTERPQVKSFANH